MKSLVMKISHILKRVYKLSLSEALKMAWNMVKGKESLTKKDFLNSKQYISFRKTFICRERKNFTLFDFVTQYGFSDKLINLASKNGFNLFNPGNIVHSHQFDYTQYTK